MNYVQMTNAPAFPDGLGKKGMTLRDYFAAKAMQGLLAGLLADGQDLKWDQVAIDSYRQADAMLKAREA
jgi:hypothetical protein